MFNFLRIDPVCEGSIIFCGGRSDEEDLMKSALDSVVNWECAHSERMPGSTRGNEAAQSLHAHVAFFYACVLGVYSWLRRAFGHASPPKKIHKQKLPFGHVTKLLQMFIFMWLDWAQGPWPWSPIEVSIRWAQWAHGGSYSENMFRSMGIP